MELELRLAARPILAVVVRANLPVKPLTAVAVIPVVQDAPGLQGRVSGAVGAMTKS